MRKFKEKVTTKNRIRISLRAIRNYLIKMLMSISKSSRKGKKIIKEMQKVKQKKKRMVN